MAEPDAKAAQAGAASTTAGGPSPRPPKPANPVWRMMGLPNIRFKLPSRNWMIFLSITGSWTAAVMYDRREKKRIQKKWIKVVEHIAQEPLDTQQLPRKVTVFLSAPPADGLVPARDHFHEYVKPILVAAALDWDAVEGRREGDIRAGLAERIRKVRKKRGEKSAEPIEEGMQELLEATRQRAGVSEWSGHGGDIVVGRHTWKEYVRGLHEGWLGPLDIPPSLEEVEAAPEPTPVAPGSTPEPKETTPEDTTTATTAAIEATASTLATATEKMTTIHPPESDDASPTALPDEPPKEEPEKPKEEEKKKKKKRQPPPFIKTTEYENAMLPATCPQALGPTVIVPLPHLLGFFNFPIRMYRFLNRRQDADVIGRETAAAVLGTYRPFETAGENTVSISSDDENISTSSTHWEQQRLLIHEEPDWHKSARKREEGDDRERVWFDGMVLDPRIAERMRRFALQAEVEERAKKIKIDDGKPWFSSLWPKEKQKGAWEGLSDD